MNFYPRHLGDYAKDTHHLSLVEHGVLNLLLDRLYSSEKPFSRKEAYQICRPSSKTEKQAVERVLTDYFVDTGAGFINHRALREIEKYHEKSNKARQSAMSRWSPEKDANAMRTHSERNAKAMLSNNQYPITNNQESVTNKSITDSQRRNGLQSVNGSLSSIVRRLDPK
jgi:uncharacterized protein YdaU (DUF1376 family)